MRENEQLRGGLHSWLRADWRADRGQLHDPRWASAPSAAPAMAPPPKRQRAATKGPEDDEQLTLDELLQQVIKIHMCIRELLRFYPP